MTVWFTSDTHFNHKNIIRYCGRPFVDVSDMNETIIRKWNACVRPNDTIFHLGDFGLFRKGQEPQRLLDRLNGDVKLCQGNHDRRGEVKRAFGSDLQKAYGYQIKDALVVMVHKPCNFPAVVQTDNWDDVILLYGHVHDKAISELHRVEFPDGRSVLAYHVGVDTNNFAPVPEHVIQWFADNKDDCFLPTMRVGLPEKF